jgi:hypothetical protein
MARQIAKARQCEAFSQGKEEAERLGKANRLG